jgi:hypothetical protein
LGRGVTDELRAAWDDMIERLQRARDAIDDASLYPPPASDRNLAEGYRYLLGHAHAAIERAFHADPARPHFRNALSIVTRATIDNPDAIYFYAPVDGRRSYLLRGEIGDARHWRGEPPAPTGRKAPHYLIFEASWGPLAGDTGSLAELRPGMKTQTGRIDSSEIGVNPDGSFEILFAPERPADWTGNFVSTLKVVSQPHPTDPSLPPQRFAQWLSGRQLFNDWAREDAIHFEMAPLDADADVARPYSAEQAAAELRRCGEIVRGQMHFWNAFWTVLMGTYGPRPGTLPGVGFPRNAFNRVNAASAATGGGMSTNLYAGGIAELAEDEALVVENRIRLAPQYLGFQLGNLWGESVEYANCVGSRNGWQSRVDEDGAIRLVIAHRDPGVQNWLDATGHPAVFMSPRWAYSKTPPTEQWPTLSATKVKLADVRAHLPASTPPYSAAQRRAEIAARQRHVRKRFRVF